MLFLELALVLLLTLVNGALAMSELAIVSSRPARLKTLVERGTPGARAALALAGEPGRFLSSVQIGITLVGVLAGAISGATLGERLSGWFSDLGVPSATAYVLGVGLVVGFITYLSLVVGELVPKRLALADPEAIACRVGPAMTVVARISSPFVYVLDASSGALLRLLGRADERQQAPTEDEIKTLVAEAESAGVLKPDERRMISSVLRLGDRPVSGVMTPRLDLVMVDLAAPVADSLELMRAGAHSRFPCHDGNPEEVAGIIWAKDLMGRADIQDLRPFVRAVPVLPEALDALEAVEILRRSSVHMGLVHDEYGHFLGAVTTADILEAIVGAFATTAGEATPGIVTRADGSLLIEGWMAADELADQLGLVLPETRAYDTAPGVGNAALGRQPQVGDSTRIQHWTFEVMDLDGRRVDKLLATRAGD